jgi:predicted SnoaL-like aldol condensation-catalyzing enzyme
MSATLVTPIVAALGGKMVTVGIHLRAAGAIAAAAFVAVAACAQPSPLEANKRIATEFYDAAINRKDFAAASQYLGSNYRQHNPTAADGAEGLRAFIDFLKMRYPNQRGAIKRVIAEGDLVVLHVHSTRGDDTPGRAIVDVFRIENGKVVEHWDVIQDIPAKPANQNGMF